MWMFLFSSGSTEKRQALTKFHQLTFFEDKAKFTIVLYCMKLHWLLSPLTDCPQVISHDNFCSLPKRKGKQKCGFCQSVKLIFAFRQCWSILIRIWEMKGLQRLSRNSKMHMRYKLHFNFGFLLFFCYSHALVITCLYSFSGFT